MVDSSESLNEPILEKMPEVVVVATASGGKIEGFLGNFEKTPAKDPPQSVEVVPI